LRVKINEEFEAREHGVSDVTSKTVFMKRYNKKRREVNRKSDSKDISSDKAKRDRAKLKCCRCNKTCHFVKDCKVQKKEKVVSDAEHTGLCEIQNFKAIEMRSRHDD